MTSLLHLNHIVLLVVWTALFVGLPIGVDIEIALLAVHASLPIFASLAQRPASAKRAFLVGPMPWLAAYCVAIGVYAFVESGRFHWTAVLALAAVTVVFALYAALVCTAWAWIARLGRRRS